MVLIFTNAARLASQFRYNPNTAELTTPLSSWLMRMTNKNQHNLTVQSLLRKVLGPGFTVQKLQSFVKSSKILLRPRA